MDNDHSDGNGLAQVGECRREKEGGDSNLSRRFLASCRLLLCRGSHSGCLRTFVAMCCYIWTLLPKIFENKRGK